MLAGFQPSQENVSKRAQVQEQILPQGDEAKSDRGEEVT